MKNFPGTHLSRPQGHRLVWRVMSAKNSNNPHRESNPRPSGLLHSASTSCATACLLNVIDYRSHSRIVFNLGVELPEDRVSDAKNVAAVNDCICCYPRCSVGVMNGQINLMKMHGINNIKLDIWNLACSLVTHLSQKIE